MDERLMDPNAGTQDKNESGLRPKKLDDFFGQTKVKENLKVFIQAALERREPLDHVLLYGPPGLGKTTLANIIATEMGVNFRITSAPPLKKAGDLAAILTNLGNTTYFYRRDSPLKPKRGRNLSGYGRPGLGHHHRKRTGRPFHP